MITTSPPSIEIKQKNQFFKRRSELGLILLANLIVDSAYILVNLSLHSKIPSNLFLFILVALLISLAAHIANWILVPKADGVILPVVLLLNGLGYVMIYRLDVFNKRPEAPNQLLWTVIGVTVYIATMAIVKRSRDLDRYRYLLLLASLILLASPLVPGVGADINGARLWVVVGGLAFQPVEIAKLTLTIFFASYFVEKREMLTISTKRFGNRMIPDLRPFGPLALALALSLFAIGTEHDVGFSLLLFVLFVSMIWLATGKLSYVIVGLVLFAVGTFVGSHVLVQVNARIFGWLHPYSNPFGTIPNKPSGYQLIQGMVALARGGIGGKGWGLGLTGIYVPVPQSDYIFAAFGEELGLFGATAILVGFLLIVGSGLRIAATARSEFSKLLAAGLTILIGFQTFFILAGIERVLPLTGITLPWMSYGGSSLISNYFLLAILMRISTEANDRSLDDILNTV